MLLNEADRRPRPNPLYMRIHSVDNRKTFYYQPGTMEILQELPLVEACKGGILCEELG